MATKKKKASHKTSDIIDAETKVFLAAGGEVQQIKQGATSVPDKRTGPVQISLNGRDG